MEKAVINGPALGLELGVGGPPRAFAIALGAFFYWAFTKSREPFAPRSVQARLPFRGWGASMMDEGTWADVQMQPNKGTEGHHDPNAIDRLTPSNRSHIDIGDRAEPPQHEGAALVTGLETEPFHESRPRVQLLSLCRTPTKTKRPLHLGLFHDGTGTV